MGYKTAQGLTDAGIKKCSCFVDIMAQHQRLDVTKDNFEGGFIGLAVLPGTLMQRLQTFTDSYEILIVDQRFGDLKILLFC